MNEQQLEEVVRSVSVGARYRSISEGLVRRLAERELAKGRRTKEAVKAVRNKLHQVGGAYQEGVIDYARWREEMESLPGEYEDPHLQDFCRRMLRLHTSTRERLSILEDFFQQTLSSLAPIHSVLDLACGLNPLALPWMPLSEGAVYHACDIYSDMADFVGAFLKHTGTAGDASVCDLAHEAPAQPAQVALLLKTLPCLEQLDKNIAPRLLEGLQAEHLLVSFPVHSLAGRRDKGMLQNYETRFREVITAKGWKIERFEFISELAFLVSRS